MIAAILHTSYIEIRKRPISEVERMYVQALDVGRLLYGIRRQEE